MNYYQHHIGDFNNATRHLDRLERAIYREMIEMYYDTEEPLPLDFKKLCHKLCARREGEPEIVQAILDEFFLRTDEGWVHERCESELEAYRERGKELEERKENEKERKRLHRERRKALFASLREIGITPKWNVTVEELERLLDQGRAKDADRSGTGLGHPRTETTADAQETTSDATGTAKPVNQEPLTNNHKPVEREQRASRLPADWSPSDEQVLFCKLNRPDLKPVEVGMRFRDYWIAQPGAKGRKTDWDATWRNWVRNERRQSQPYQTAADKSRAIADALTGRNRERPTADFIDLN